jgi:iron-sulfur cluster assembly accessory protein
MKQLLCTIVAFALVICLGCNDSTEVSNASASTNPTESTARDTDSPSNQSVVELTDAAIAKFVAFLNDTPNDHIRLSVKREGPTGFMYDLQIESPPWGDNDLVDRSNGFTIVVSPRDSIYLDGATIDWETRPDGTEGFKFNNPNAIEH